MEHLFKELDIESSRWDDKNYYGVVFVHPDDRGHVVDYLQSFENVNVDQTETQTVVVFSSGAHLKILNVNQRYICGYEFTTVIISRSSFGRFDADRFKFKPVDELVDPDTLIADFSKRLRSCSKYPSRMVII